MARGFIEKILQASPEAQVIIGILAFLSIFSWAIIGWKFVLVKKAEKELRDFMDTFRKAKDLDAINQAAKGKVNSPIEALVTTAVREVHQLRKIISGSADRKGEFDPTVMIRDTLMMSLERTLSEKASIMRKHIVFLATTSSISPFFGLLGTVWGIMIAFLDIAAKGSANIAVVAPGIADALITTVIGLAVAIPAVIGYNYLNNRIRGIVDTCSNFSLELSGIIYKSSLSF